MALELTDEQLAVVNHQLPGHGRVLAGPGTGKSTTAVELARRLRQRSPPHRAKFLTFTRAATAELAKKLESGEAGILGRPSTIHSFSISVLLQNPGCASFPEPLRIPDKYERENLIRRHLALQMGMRVFGVEELMNEMAAMWESLNPLESPEVDPLQRARFMGAWLKHRRTFGYTLLDELPDLFRCALRDNDNLKGIDFDLLVVDEYQDLNACDLDVLHRLADRGISILAIGDDDQSIYSFRKARPEGIRRFLREYGSKCDYKLTTCHRSPRRVMDWANHVVLGDLDREPRKPPRCCDEATVGTVALLRFKSEKSEAKGVADLVSWLRTTNGVPPGEILVLSRTDRSGVFTAPIKREFELRGIPISDPSVVENMMAEPMNRHLLAILRLAENPIDSLAIWTLLKLTKGIGDGFISYILKIADDSKSTFGEAFVSAAANSFEGSPKVGGRKAKDLWSEASESFGGVKIPVDIGNIKWGNWILEEVDSDRLPSCTESLRDLLQLVDEQIEEGEELSRYLSQIHVVGADILRAKSEGVRFETIMGSKGLTVTATIVVGVDNDLIPRPDQDINEERRLLYVAMTRSREYLFLTWAGRRRGPGARSGNPNFGVRHPCEFLRGGPVESQDGKLFVEKLLS